MATSLLLKVCVLSALTCLSRITFTCGSSTSSTPNLQSTDLSSNSTKGLSPESTDDKGVVKNSATEWNTTNSAGRKPYHQIIDSMLQARKRSAKSLISPEFTMDKFVVFVTTSNNILNSKTNYTKLDKLTKSFSSLYNSDGTVAVLNFWNMWVNVWTVFDAVANIFRAYETRALNTKDENQPQPPDPLEDLQQSLDDANNNIAEVSDLFQQLKRMGEFDDFAEQQESDDGDTQEMQMLERRLLQDVPQDKQNNGNDVKNTYHDDHEEYGEEDKIRPGRKAVTIRQESEQHFAVETKRHFNYPVGYSSNSADNPKNHRSLAKASDYPNPVTRSRRIEPFAVEIKSRKRKSNQKSLISESTSERSSKRSWKFALDRINLKHGGIRSKRSNFRFNFGVDKFIYFMAKANNVLNSNTNNVQLNRFTRAFNDLFASDGLTAFNTFYTLLASFWTNVDAVANVFRFNEARIRDQIQQQQAAAQPDPLADLQTELDDTNANLAEVADLVSTLQNGAGARSDTAGVKTNSGFSHHNVNQHKKKNHRNRPSHEGNNHRVGTSPSPHQAIPSFGKQKSYKNQSRNTSDSIPISPVATTPHSHFPSGGWKPITENPQPLVETNRNFYYPVSIGSIQSSRRQHTQSFSTVNLNPVNRDKSNSGTIHRVNHRQADPASPYPMYHSTNVAVGDSSNRPTSFETNRQMYSASHNHYRTYGRRAGRLSKVNQRYGETSAIVQSTNN